MPKTFTFHAARDGDTFEQDFIASDCEEAESMALDAINTAWRQSYDDYHDMVADCDGTDMVEHPAVMAQRIPAALLDTLIGLAREAITIRAGDDEDDTDPEVMDSYRADIAAAECALRSVA